MIYNTLDYITCSSVPGNFIVATTSNIAGNTANTCCYMRVRYRFPCGCLRPNLCCLHFRTVEGLSAPSENSRQLCKMTVLLPERVGLKSAQLVIGLAHLRSYPDARHIKGNPSRPEQKLKEPSDRLLENKPATGLSHSSTKKAKTDGERKVYCL